MGWDRIPIYEDSYQELKREISNIVTNIWYAIDELEDTISKILDEIEELKMRIERLEEVTQARLILFMDRQERLSLR